MSDSAYPNQLAANLRAIWEERFDFGDAPDVESLNALLDVGYQVSLLNEESESVQCRLLLAESSDFEPDLAGGGMRRHVLRFQKPLALTPHELRKLSAATGVDRSLIGIHRGKAGGLMIWGLVLTGRIWNDRLESAPSHDDALPNRLVVRVQAPGNLILKLGEARLVELDGGRILREAFDPFHSSWLSKRFEHVRALLLESAGLQVSENQGCRICDNFVKDVAQSLVRRVFQIARSREHGGMLVYLPDDVATDIDLESWFRFRVRFADERSNDRFRILMRRLIIRAATIGESRGLEVVTWADYHKMLDEELREIDEALVDFSHLLADLMNADGCLVVDRGFRLIGFGAEILGNEHVQTIHRASDLEGTHSLEEPADGAGTRHRAAYRLVNGISDAIALVVSQDGDVRFVAQHDDRLIYWPYLP